MSKVIKKPFKDPKEPGHCMPNFTLEPADVEAVEGEKLEVHANVSGVPAPRVQWIKGRGISIREDRRRSLGRNPETGKYSLTINSCVTSDLGRYKVVAMNDYGEVTAFFNMKITEKSKDAFKINLKKTDRSKAKTKVKKTQEELEKEVIEILKTADPKDYEKICMQYGFFDFRYILHKLKELKPQERDLPEFEAAKVLRGLRHVTVNDEGTAVFEIHMEQANPDRELRWLKDGELVQVPGEEKRHELRRVGNVYQLIIRNVKPEDAGAYTLEVGKQRFTANLTIKERPLGFESELKNQKGTMKGRCVFECTVTRRNLKILWLKDGKEIKFAGGLDRLQAVSEGRVHKLIIMELRKEDTAKYTAKVDKLESSATLTVSSAPVRFRNRLVDTEVKEKSTAYFECSVTNRDLEAKWLINGKPITSTGRYKITRVGDKHTLFIEKVTMADNGAKVEIKVGDASSSAKLNVNEKPIKVLKKMDDVKCRTGGRAEFTCEIDDKEQKNVKWFKEEKEIKIDKTKYEVLSRGGKHTLYVKDITFEDEGHYTFQVRGVRLGASLSCTNPPTIDKKFLEKVRKDPLKFRAGTKARIVIPIIAKEPMTVSWTNGRVTLEERGRYHMENSATEAVVEVQSCRISDSGEYELTIVNENGDVTVSIPVRIVDKPNPPSGEIKFSEIEKSSLKMRWEEPVNMNIPFDNYIIEMQVEGSSTWKKIGKVSSKETSYKATGLATGKTHKFRVKSSNSEGESEPLESDGVTPCEPDQPPKIDPKVIEQLAKNPIRVNAGETATIRVPVQGNPPPSAAWFHDGDEILPVKHHRAKKDSTLKEATLVITKCNRTDNGEYEGRIFNNVGGIVVKTKIIVNDVPAFKEGAKVKVDKVTPKDVKMSWDAPEDDGNQPITGYEIERAVVGSDKWQKVGDAKPGTTNFTAGNLTPGEKYEFRVKAKNSRGASAPIKSSPVTCGSVVSPPTIDPKLFDELTKTPIKVRAGQTGRLKVPLSGEPVPTATWAKDGESLEGPGPAEGAPSPATKPKPTETTPEGVPVFKEGATVKVEKVTRKEVKMSWDAPIDEGDQPLTGYDIEKSKPGSDDWEKVGETKPGTTSFTAGGCEPGETYVFRVKAKNIRGSSKPVTSSPVKTKAGPGVPAFKDGATVQIEKVTKKEVTMSWEAPDDDGDLPLTGYDIEKLKEGAHRWEKVGEAKPKETSFTASNCTAGETYVFRVKAKNSRGSSEPVTSRPVTCGDTPNVPAFSSDAEVSFDKVTTQDVKMSWKEPDDNGNQPITGYEIEKSVYGTGKWDKVGETKPGTTEFTAGSCAPGETYLFRVKAKNKTGTSEPLTSSPVTCASRTGVPVFGKDAEIKIDKSSLKGIKMSWDRPANDGDQPITGYEVERAKSGTNQWEKVGETQPGTTDFTSGDCAPGETYVFRVKAKNNRGISEPVTSAPVTCRSDEGVPSFKDGATVKVDKITPKEVKMSWDAPATSGDLPLSGYDIERKVEGTDTWEKVGETKPGTTGFTASNCAPGETYVFRVKAKNNLGSSKPVTTSPVTCPTTNGVPAFAKDAKVIAENVSPKEVKMSWDAPIHEGDKPVSGYEIERSIAGTDKWEKVGDTKAGTTSFTASNCAPGKTYVFRVKAKNPKGASAPVTSAPITCKSGTGAPHFMLDSEVKVDNSTPNEVKMTWDAPAKDGGQPLDGYDIEKSVAGTDKWEKIGETGPGTRGFTAKNGVPGETYIFRVKAKNSRGASEPVTSAPIAFKHGPAAPTFKDGATVKVDKITPKEVKMSWDAPATSGDQPLSGYDIERKVEGTDTWEKVGETKPDTTGFTAAGCQPGETYVFRVKAKNSHGPSKPVTTAPVTCSSTSGVPVFEKDAKVTAENVSPKEVKMSWDAPTNEGDKPVSGYEIEKSVAGSDKWEKVGDTKPGQTSFTASNCAPGETYLFRVKAKNPKGASEPVTSSPVTCKSGTDVPTFKLDTKVKVDNSVPNKVKMTWDAPAKDGDQPLSGYDIEKSIAGTDKWEKVGETRPGTTGFTSKDCKPGETYVFRVKAKNSRGESKPVISEPIRCKPKPSVPSFDDDAKVKVDKITPKEVKMSWDAPENDGEQPLAGYDIERTVAGTDDWKKVGETKPGTTGFTASNCAPGETYVFRVKAKNALGSSKPVTTSPVTCATPNGVPAFARDAKVIAENVSPKEVKMSWDAPANEGDKPVSGYEIEKSIAGTDKWEKVGDTKAGTTSFTASNCATGKTYVFRVKAKNAKGASAPVTSAPITCKSGTGVPSFKPGSKVKVDNSTPNQVKMTWDAPAKDGDQPLDGYDIEKSISGTDKWEKIGETEPGTTGFTAKNGEPGETYVFRVKAKNSRGSSKPVTSAPIAFKRHPDSTAGAPAGAPSKPGAPSRPDQHRLIKDTSDAAHAQLIIHSCERTDSGKYICKLKNEAGELDIPLNVIVVDAPPAPSGNIDFSDISSKGLSVSWLAPVDDGGSKIDHYVIEKKEEGKKNWTSVGKTPGGKDTSFKVKGVPSGKTYRFRVRAVNDIGEGQSLESEPVVVKDPFDAPSKIKGDIEFETATDDSISISWPAVDNDGGSAIMGYYVEKRKKGQTSWGRCNYDEPIRDRKYTATGLRFDNEYEFRVIAVNAAGEGIPSRPSQAFLARTPVDAPGEPSDIELIDSTNTSLTLAWKGTDQEGGAELLGYEIEIKEEYSEHWQLWTDGAIMGTSCVLRGLKEGAGYNVRMRSVNRGAKSKYYYYRGTMVATEVLTAPTFRMTPELEACCRDGFNINAGSTIRINVPYTGRPRPQIIWLKDGAELDETVEVVSSTGVDQMTIRNARGYHSGIYTITLKNSSGTETLKVPVKVYDVPMPPSSPLKVQSETDKGVTISWQPPRYDGGKPIRGYVIQTRDARGRDWQTVAQNVIRCTYVCDSLQKSRSYYFRVLAENEIGRSDPLECKTVVYIKQEVAKVHIEEVHYTEKDLRTPPQITVPMKPRIVPEGVKVTLSCSISGKPHPQIKWFKDNKDITDNSNYFKENVIGLCRLVLKSVKTTDAGVYKVVAENPVGTATCQANLVVER